jgi:hypothetical protein
MTEAPRIYPTFRYRDAASDDRLARESARFQSPRQIHGRRPRRSRPTVVWLGNDHAGIRAQRRVRHALPASRANAAARAFIWRSTTRTLHLPAPKPPAQKCWKSRPTATMAAANACWPTRRAISGRLARIGRRRMNRHDQIADCTRTWGRTHLRHARYARRIQS